jgi:hypothetical protein
MLWEPINADLTTQLAGSIVRRGAAGTVVLAQADSPANASGVVGSRWTDVLAGNPGPVMPINTGLIVRMAMEPGENDIVYLSSLVAGEGTIVRPSSPNSVVPLGLCYSKNNVGGIWLAHIVPNITLDEPVPEGIPYNPGSGAQVVTLDCGRGSAHVVAGNAAGTTITFAITDSTGAQCFFVSVLQGAASSTIAAWFATVKWAGGSPPTLTTTPGKRDTFGFIRTGTNTYDGFVVGQNC